VVEGYEPTKCADQGSPASSGSIFTNARQADATAALNQWAFEHKDVAMRTKKPADGGKPTTVVVDEFDDLKGTLKHIGGSQSDHWNNVLGNQALETLWLKHSDERTRDRQCNAVVAALVGIAPKDEIEAMIAAQLIAAHNAGME